jgi:predicted Rossmann fold nucleotide-binding protein DprA/Smf involved in DNA uptake
VLNALGADTLHIDDLCQKMDASIEKLTAQLTLMELKGQVVRVKGMEYAAIQSWKYD